MADLLTIIQIAAVQLDPDREMVVNQPNPPPCSQHAIEAGYLPPLAEQRRLDGRGEIDVIGRSVPDYIKAEFWRPV